MEEERTPKALLGGVGVTMSHNSNNKSPQFLQSHHVQDSVLETLLGLSNLFLTTALGGRLHYNPTTQLREMKLREVK